jgi:hypothetical protein
LKGTFFTRVHKLGEERLLALSLAIYHGLVWLICAFVLHMQPNYRTIHVDAFSLIILTKVTLARSNIMLTNMGARCLWRSWLRHSATSRKVACSFLDSITGFFY